MPVRTPLFYTFGNHMHWVDMEWLWGYHVLPGSVRDMVHFCRETGAKGNVNFDGIGYEKLAAEDPEAFAELRDAVRAGTIEVVGASYGQPYGLFHGGESNLRQRIYGARAVRRLFGVWPKTFWEEEFDFFPQLPQMLASCGFRHASLFFQWTWHTPEVPVEDVPAIRWEGQDGTRLLAATRNRLNLHQWPEDVALLMDELAEAPPQDGGQVPMVLQWLELMPSPDWMCRSEVLLPRTKELLADERFEFRFGTLGEYLGSLDPDAAPVRAYQMDEVWHGLSLGKNGDAHPRRSHFAEASLLQAEALAAMLGLFGRPYADWDVYPTWELEEGWRNLLAAQHHDNHECEGLCGHVAEHQFDTVASLTDDGTRGIDHLARRVPHAEGEVVVANPFGWERTVVVHVAEPAAASATVAVPAYGYTVVPAKAFRKAARAWRLRGDAAVFEREGFRVEVDLSRGRVRSMTSAAFPAGLTDFALPALEWTVDRKLVRANRFRLLPDHDRPDVLTLISEPNGEALFELSVPPDLDALDVQLSFEPAEAFPDFGINAGCHAIFRPPFAWTELRVDHPYAVSSVVPQGERLRKYPEGDWMTSPQWFESVANPFTGQTFVDLLEPSGRGVLILHDGSQQWLREGETLRNAVLVVDPWDGDRFVPNADVRYRIVPHGAISDAERWRMGRELFGTRLVAEEAAATRAVPAISRPNETGDLPRTFSALRLEGEHALITAWYRETTDPAGRHVEDYAARDVGYPYVVRVVEFDGVGGDVRLVTPATVAGAWKTNALGGGGTALSMESRGGETTVTLPLRPFEIATVYLDLVEGRKQVRDLDAARSVWATVHRVEGLEPSE